MLPHKWKSYEAELFFKFISLSNVEKYSNYKVVQQEDALFGSFNDTEWNVAEKGKNELSEFYDEKVDNCVRKM